MADQASKPTYLVDDGSVVDLAANEPAPDEAPLGALLGELARAMHRTAASEYERLTAELERLRAEQVEAIESRAAVETERLQAESDRDVDAIHSWAQAESDRIGLERERRVDARRERLARQLERRHTIKEREVFAVQVAADGHRGEVDECFGRLEREANPTAIAQLAATLPALPAFDEIAEDARRGAEAEFTTLHGPAELPPDESMPVTLTVVPDQPAVAVEPIAPISQSRLMAVMDPAASRRDGAAPARPWEAAPHAVGVASGPPSAEVYPADWPRVEPRQYAIVPRSRSGSLLLQAIPAKRPAVGRDPRL